MNVVLIEDDKAVSELIKYLLEKSFFECETYSSAEAYLGSGKFSKSEIYIIDNNLPGIKGSDLIKSIRSMNHLAYIIMVSGLVLENDVTIGLSSGADDYVSKPFNPDHLLVKLQNAKAKLISLSKVNLNSGIKLIPEGPMISIRGSRVGINAKEYLVFEKLLKNYDRVVSKTELNEAINDPESLQKIDFHIHSLRKKIGSQSVSIRNIRGSGYCLTLV